LLSFGHFRIDPIFATGDIDVAIAFDGGQIEQFMSFAVEEAATGKR
jgi:hypothetical protein